MSQLVTPRRPNRPARGAFTLVELLVVVGIIAVLISVLLPALGKAVARANDVACLSNLRSVGQWGFLYAAENNGVLPHSGGEFGFYEDTDQIRTALHCPLLRRTITGEVRQGGENGTFDYSLNAALGGSRETRGAPRTIDLRPGRFWFGDATMRWNPSGNFLFNTRPSMECRPQSGTIRNGEPWMWEVPNNSGGGVLPTELQGHGNDQANFLLGDGHAEPYDRETIRSWAFGPGGQRNAAAYEWTGNSRNKPRPGE